MAMIKLGELPIKGNVLQEGQVDEIRAASKCRVVPQLAGRTALARGFGRFYEGEALRQLEEVQRKEVAALKAMVELLVERGVLTREEYLAKVKR